MDTTTEPEINSLACTIRHFTSVPLLSSSELRLVKEAWEYDIWDMHFVWECGWISQGKG